MKKYERMTHFLCTPRSSDCAISTCSAFLKFPSRCHSVSIGAVTVYRLVTASHSKTIIATAAADAAVIHRVMVFTLTTAAKERSTITAGYVRTPIACGPGRHRVPRIVTAMIVCLLLQPYQHGSLSAMTHVNNDLLCDIPTLDPQGLVDPHPTSCSDLPGMLISE